MKRIRLLLIMLAFSSINRRIEAQGVINFFYQSCTLCNSTNAASAPATLTSYSGNIQFTTLNVASDFGPRNQNGYDWHSGVDFTSESGDNDFGDKILSIEAGSIVRLGSPLNDSYQIIMVDGVNNDYAYGHIFRNSPISGSNLGNMVWFRRPNGTNVILFVGENRGISTHPGNVTYDNVTYSVSTTVLQNDPIAPIGDSGGNFDAHIHLYQIPNVTTGGNNITWNQNSHQELINPLSSVQGPVPNHNIKILNPGSNSTSTGILNKYDKSV